MFLETICLKNGILQHLAYHQARMERTLQASFLFVQDLAQYLDTGKEELQKCRVLYNHEGIKTIEYLAYTPNPPKSLQLVEANNLAYTVKYADRTALEALQARKGLADDVLIIQNGYITDTSYCNVALFDGKTWHTPAKPLLEGTTRARLLDEGKLQLAYIRPEDLKQYTCLRLFNAMLSFEDEYDISIENIGLNIIFAE